MKVLSRFVAVGACTAMSACLFTGCGSYDNPAKGTGGAGGATTGGTGGSTGGATGGTGGSSGAATGGSGGATGGSSGSGGAPTGGSGGTTGGSSGSGAQAGSGASGAPAGGSSGSGGSAGMDGAGAAGTSGGGAGQVACTDVAPCGGDLLGTWSAAGCDMAVTGTANLTAAGIGCVSAPVAGSIQVTGTWTGMAGGTFTDATTTTGQVKLELEAACLMISGFMGTCDRLSFDSTGLVGATCVDNTTTMGCTCTVPINQAGGLGAIGLEASLGNAGSGTYMTEDNKVVTTAMGIDTEYSYCVSGSRLVMTLSIPSNVGTLMSPIVLQAQ